jgi:hypothetical protein
VMMVKSTAPSGSRAGCLILCARAAAISAHRPSFDGLEPVEVLVDDPSQ